MTKLTEKQIKDIERDTGTERLILVDDNFDNIFPNDYTFVEAFTYNKDDSEFEESFEGFTIKNGKVRPLSESEYNNYEGFEYYKSMRLDIIDVVKWVLEGYEKNIMNYTLD